MTGNQPGSSDFFVRSSGRNDDSLPPQQGKQETNQLQAGTTVGHYEIISLVGTGGMSSVYKARNLKNNKIFALKLMHPHLMADANSRKRFEYEAQTVGQLDQRHIIRVYETGVDEKNNAYLVMDYLEGRALSDAVKEDGPFSLNRAVVVFLQASEALDHAHRSGVIHRDLKPSNIMLLPSPPDYVKLLDFGMAKFLPSEGTEQQYLTRTGEVFGSPLYMSPEQCMGQPLDERCDIYSMGCLMYEVLTGNPPLVGGNVWETFSKQVNDMPAPIAGQPGITKDDRMLIMDAIILKCMAKTPKDRYRSMVELQKALSELVGNVSLLTSMKADLQLRQAKKSAKVNKVDFSKRLIGGLVILTGVVLGFGYYAINEFKPAEIIVQPGASPEELWKTINTSGQQRFDKGDYRAALSQFNQAIEAFSKEGQPKTNVQISALYEGIDAARALGDDARAKQYLESLTPLVERRERRIRQHQKNITDQMNDSTTDRDDLESLCVQANDTAAADLLANAPNRDLLQQALKIQKGLDANSPAALVTLQNLAAIDLHDNKDDESINELNEVRDKAKKLHRDVPSSTIQMLVELALRSKDYEKAKALTTELLKQALKSSEPTQIIPWCKVRLAQIAMHDGDFAKATTNLEAAKTSYSESSSGTIDAAKCSLLLAQCKQQGDEDINTVQKEALDGLTAVESLLIEDNPRASHMVGEILVYLGTLYAGPLKDPVKAEASFLRAIWIGTRPGEIDNDLTDSALAELLKLKKSVNKSEELRALGNRLLSTNLAQKNVDGVTSDYLFLGDMLGEKRVLEASSFYEKALSNHPANDMRRVEILARLSANYTKVGHGNTAQDLLSQAVVIIEQHRTDAKRAPELSKAILDQYTTVFSDRKDSDQYKLVETLKKQLSSSK